ncbi:MAG TPA: hypothetical protein VGL66_12295 [Caulobacteraceae bacterium]|jgi:hypothetical protein
MSIVGRFFAGCGLALCLCLALSACTPKASPSEETQSRAAYAAIQAGDVAKLQSLVAPNLRAQITPEAMKQIGLSASSEKLIRVATVDVLTVPSNKGAVTLLETEYDYPDNYYAVLRTRFLRAPGAATEEMIYVDLRSETPAQIAQESVLRARIDRNRKIVTGLAIASWLVMLLAVVELLYSRPKGWIWWLVSVLIGFCKIGVNLVSGQLTFGLLNVSFLGFSIGSGLNFGSAAGLVATVTIPVFALYSLSQSGQSLAYRRRINKMKAAAAKEAAANPAP